MFEGMVWRQARDRIGGGYRSEHQAQTRLPSCHVGSAGGLGSVARSQCPIAVDGGIRGGTSEAYDPDQRNAAPTCRSTPIALCSRTSLSCATYAPTKRRASSGISGA